MSDGSKPHVGGTVTEGVEGVFIDGIPVAVKGSKCKCTGSSKANSITNGSPGVFVDGEQIAIVGSMTEHGGIVIEGVPGVTVSGGFPVQACDEEKPEPRVFNLQWRDGDKVTKWGEVGNKVLLSADTVGYEDGEEVVIKIYEKGSSKPIANLTGTVQDGRVEVEWETTSKNENS